MVHFPGFQLLALHYILMLQEKALERLIFLKQNFGILPEKKHEEINQHSSTSLFPTFNAGNQATTKASIAASKLLLNSPRWD